MEVKPLQQNTTLLYIINKTFSFQKSKNDINYYSITMSPELAQNLRHIPDTYRTQDTLAPSTWAQNVRTVRH